MATIGRLVGKAKVKEIKNSNKNVRIPNRLINKNKKVMRHEYSYYTAAEEVAIQELIDYGFAKNRRQAINTLVSEGKLVKEKTGAGQWLEGHGGFWGLLQEAQDLLRGGGVEEGEDTPLVEETKGMPAWAWVAIIVAVLAVITIVVVQLTKKK